MGIGIIFVGVVAYIVVQAVVRSNGNERKKRQYGGRDNSADNNFFPGESSGFFTGDTRSDDSGHRHNDGHNGASGHHSHSHGGSSWDNGPLGGHGGWDSGGHGGHGGGDSGGGGSDSGGGGGGDSGGGGGD